MTDSQSGNPGSTFPSGDPPRAGLSCCISCQHASRTVRMAMLYLSGMTLDEVGSHFGLTRERVRQILTRFGITKTPAEAKEERRKRRLEAGILTKWDVEQQGIQRRKHERALKVREVIRRYESGETMREVADALGMHTTTVCRMLHKHGITTKRRGVRRGTRKYPWSEWFDGEWHVAERGVHFACKPISFQGRIYQAAHERGYTAETTENNGIVMFRVHPMQPI